MGVRTRSRSDGGAVRAAGRRLLVLLAVAVCVLAWTGAPARAGREQWTWPLAGPPPVARAFAPPPSPYAPGHRGVDVAAAPGAPVLAAGAGRVSYAGLLAGRGVVVVVHGDLRTTYEPVTPAVAVGQQVARGQVLGGLAGGHEGCAAATCLHWGLRRGEQYLDPLVLVGAGPVRLLPLESAGAAGAGPSPSGGAGAAGRVEGLPDGPAPDGTPPFDLRGAAGPSGALAVLALLAGLALLVRPRPPGAPGGGASAVAPVRTEPAQPDVELCADADVLDLDRQRLIRRAGAG